MNLFWMPWTVLNNIPGMRHMRKILGRRFNNKNHGGLSMRKLFGTDGIRGVAGKELSADLAFHLGNAVAQTVKKDGIKSLLIAKDTRVSCDMLEAAVASGASSGGMNVMCCGIMPTPALAKVTDINHSAGVMISASHNSFEYNGLKVMKDGFKLPDLEEEEIEDIMLAGSIKAQTHHE